MAEQGMVTYSVRVPWTIRDSLRTHRKSLRKSWPYAAGGAAAGVGATLLMRRFSGAPGVFARKLSKDLLAGAGSGAALFGGTAHTVAYQARKRRTIVNRAWDALTQQLQAQRSVT